MPDKSFNEQPMLVVVSDALDPRIKRQLQSQLQAEMMTVGQLDAEIKNQESMEAIKQQYDSKKDESKFDENETQDEQNAQPIEQTANNNSGNGEQGNASGGEADPFAGGESNAGAAQENGGGGQQDGGNPQTQNAGSSGSSEGNGQSDADAFSANGNDAQNTEGEQGGQNQPAQADQSQQAGSDDPFGGDSGQAQTQKAPEQNQQAQNNQQANTQQQPNQDANGDAANADGGDDPFSDDVKFEAFAGIFNDRGFKSEDAGDVKQTDAEKDTHPPLKQVVFVAASDRGVDERTNHVVAALEDPQNTVVVIDITDLTEAEAKMQFSAMKKSLQERGVTVTDTVDEAVEYLNDVYDQIAGKAE